MCVTEKDLHASFDRALRCATAPRSCSRAAAAAAAASAAPLSLSASAPTTSASSPLSSFLPSHPQGADADYGEEDADHETEQRQGQLHQAAHLPYPPRSCSTPMPISMHIVDLAAGAAIPMPSSSSLGISGSSHAAAPSTRHLRHALHNRVTVPGEDQKHGEQQHHHQQAVTAAAAASAAASEHQRLLARRKAEQGQRSHSHLWRQSDEEFFQLMFHPPDHHHARRGLVSATPPTQCPAQQQRHQQEQQLWRSAPASEPLTPTPSPPRAYRKQVEAWSCSNSPLREQRRRAAHLFPTSSSCDGGSSTSSASVSRSSSSIRNTRVGSSVGSGGRMRSGSSGRSSLSCSNTPSRFGSPQQQKEEIRTSGGSPSTGHHGIGCHAFEARSRFAAPVSGNPQAGGSPASRTIDCCSGKSKPNTTSRSSSNSVAGATGRLAGPMPYEPEGQRRAASFRGTAVTNADSLALPASASASATATADALLAGSDARFPASPSRCPALRERLLSRGLFVCAGEGKPEDPPGDGKAKAAVEQDKGTCGGEGKMEESHVEEEEMTYTAGLPRGCSVDSGSAVCAAAAATTAVGLRVSGALKSILSPTANLGRRYLLKRVSFVESVKIADSF